MALSEIVKLFTNKIVIIFVIAMLFINGMAFYIHNSYFDTDSASVEASSYKELLDDLSVYSDEEVMNIVSNKIDELNELIRTNNWVVNYTDNIFSEKNLYLSVYSEISQVQNYSDTISTITNNSERLLKKYEKSDVSRYELESIALTSEKYNDLSNINTSFGPSKGVNAVLSNIITDVTCVFAMFLAIIILLTSEREKNLLILSKTTKNGGFRHCLIKLITIVIWGAFISAILLVEDIIIADSMYGIGNLTRSIQSLYGWNMCPLSVNIVVFIGITYVVRLIFFVFCACFFWIVCNLVKRTVPAYVVNFGIVILMYLIKILIPDNSYLEWLRQLNPLNLGNVKTLFAKFSCINIGNHAFGYSTVAIIIMLVATIIFFIIGSILYCKTSEKEINAIIYQPRLKINHLHVSVFLHEAYKIFIIQHVLLIIIMAAIAAALTYAPADNAYSQPSEFYYELYSKQWSGQYSDDVVKEIKNKLDEDYAKQEEIGDTTSVESVTWSISALEDLILHMDYLKENDSDTNPSYLFYDKGYVAMAGVQNNSQLYNTILSVVFLILSVTLVYSIDYVNGEIKIIKCTKNGLKKYSICKYIFVAFLVLYNFSIFNIPELISAINTFGTGYACEAANNIEYFKGVPEWISVGACIALIYITRCIGMFISAIIVFWSIKKIKNFALSIMASCAIILMPLVLYLLGIEFFRYFPVTGLLIGIF